VHILVAGAIGFKARAPNPAALDPISELRQALGSGDVHADIQAPVILDFGRLKAAAKKRSA
jgi:HAMP domain-containing protein